MCFHWRRWWHVPSSRIACSSDMFLKSGGYWEDLEPVGYEDLGAGKWGGRDGDGSLASGVALVCQQRLVSAASILVARVVIATWSAALAGGLSPRT